MMNEIEKGTLKKEKKIYYYLFIQEDCLEYSLKGINLNFKVKV